MEKIIEHEDWQGRPALEFLKAFWVRKSRIPFPTEAKGSVDAAINHGRYIVTCPCGGASIVSSKEPFFVCVECGSPENDGKFYNVKFPQERDKIEKALLKRPLVNRNWEKETIAELEDENRAKGVI